MASQHPNPGLRVVGSQPDQEINPDRERLAETPFTGEARLHELEQLAKTARRVREDAERELADSRTSRAIAEQRISTCERTIRKAEEEMAEIRADLYHRQHLDREASDFQSAEDFELAVLLGKATRHEKASEQDIADLELSPLPKPEKRRPPTHAKPAPFRSVPRANHKPKHGNSRRIGFPLLVTAGVVIGASATYTALKSPTIQENVAAIATDSGRLMEEVRAAVTKPGTVPAKRETRETDSAGAETPLVPGPATSTKPARDTQAAPPVRGKSQADAQPDLFQPQVVTEQRARVVKGSPDLASRASEPAGIAGDGVPAEQPTARNTASE